MLSIGGLGGFYGIASWNYRVFQAADGEDLVILACTVFDWSTHVTDG